LPTVNPAAIERANERLRQAAEARNQAAAVDAALERARHQVEALAETAASLEATLPDRVGDAVREGMREQVLPVARHLAEVRGLSAQLVRRLERIEGDSLAERHARVDDLGLLVDLITSGWTGVDERLARLERALGADENAVVQRLEDRRSGV
jgi:seryl-tRNA synthetase